MLQDAIASVDDYEFDIETALARQLGAKPLPFPGMDSKAIRSQKLTPRNKNILLIIINFKCFFSFFREQSTPVRVLFGRKVCQGFQLPVSSRERREDHCMQALAASLVQEGRRV